MKTLQNRPIPRRRGRWSAVAGALAFLVFMPPSASPEPCIGFRCPSNDTMYDASGSCHAACRNVLGAITCPRTDLHPEYAAARQMLKGAMAMLNANADGTLLDLARERGLDGRIHSGVVDHLASRFYAGDWNWVTASQGDIEDLFRSEPRSADRDEPYVGMWTDMKNCGINTGTYTGIAKTAGLAHETVHRRRCLVRNNCVVPSSGIGPARCSNPDGFGDWAKDPANDALDEVEAYCAQIRVLLDWLQAHADCDADGDFRDEQAANEARAGALCKAPPKP